MAFKIRIDTGGTFTDCWGQDEKGEIIMLKILSTGNLRMPLISPAVGREVRIAIPPAWRTPEGFFNGYSAVTSTGEQAAVTGFDANTKTLMLDRELEVRDCPWLELSAGEEAPVAGTRLLTGTHLNQAFPELDFRLATTRATNALLERKGAPLAFFITYGFGDLLEIGDQRRPDLFALCHRKRRMIYRQVVEVEERLNFLGEIEKKLNLTNIEEQAVQLREQGIRTAAVALLHAYLNPIHEQQVRECLLGHGFTHVSISSELAPLIKILPRAETAVANAYVHPVMQTFLDHIQETIGRQHTVYVMSSSGGLEPSNVFRPKDALLSGPAGGVAGAAAIARESGVGKILTFDMGGTSTDVARHDGDFVYSFEQKVGDARLLSTALKIETVASGGGSICQWTEAGLRVGPESAGADPGPACYGRGGPLTITDVNLLLGRIDPGNFGIPIGEAQIAAAQTRALQLQAAAGRKAESLDPDFLAGLLDIANEQMADAIRSISIRDGADPAEYSLLAFGGAGPLHACAIAEILSIDRVLIPAEAGILSAYGLEKSRIERNAAIQITDQGQVAQALEKVKNEAQSALGEIGQRCERLRLIAEVRLAGQDATLSLDFEKLAELPERFLVAYRHLFGYAPPQDRPMEIVSFRALASNLTPEVANFSHPTGYREPSYPVEGEYLDRGSLRCGQRVTGPVAIQDPFATFFLAPFWSATVLNNGSLLAEKQRDFAEEKRISPPEIRRELFRHRFEQIVNEMGVMLERSAISTNIKERLDFSCALLDREGTLVCSAHHIPVHLGAMGLCVRSVKKALPLRRGDTVITNHPGVGGSHLPDVTLITPVFADDTSLEPIAFVANRAHHAEIGGITPGSMPPDAANLGEEGVVISPRYLIEEGESRFEEIRHGLLAAPFPTRRVGDNMADLHAQAAANGRGVALFLQLITEHGISEIQTHIGSLKEQSSLALANHLERLDFQQGASCQQLDDGTEIAVAIERTGAKLRVDFTGTSLAHPRNLNATPAIVQSAVLYVLRLWTQSHLPLNEGLLGPVEIRLPRCFLNPEFPDDPSHCPAVVGGNVETSQRLVDTLIEALQIQAGSQGTMNNLIFGDAHFGYYETIAGGAGAGPGYDGASALHTHMTNTAITDPEILESRYPVRLERFEIRRPSGGRGKWQGGDGVIREITTLRPVKVSLLVQHRVAGPLGMAGGEEGERGGQYLNGESIGSEKAFAMEGGDVLRIETPGGGGYGRDNPVAD